MPISERKARARQAAFLRRKSAVCPELERKAQCYLAEVLHAHHGKILAGYMLINTEISPLPIMEKWRAPVCVPLVKGKSQPLDFLRWTPASEMEKGDFGALIPKEKITLIPEIIIVPLLAFNQACHRLGYGGGFYDRTLALLRKTHPITTIGFAYSAQQTPDLPLEKTDISLDAIVSEKGIIKAG